jgi:hypothetical protein
MKIYFLVEGRRTEPRIYPYWLSYLIPELARLKRFDEECINGYFIFSGYGYPHLLDEIMPNSVEDINNSGDYDYFVLVIDAEELSVQERIDEINLFIEKKGVSVGKTKIIIIIQNRCIETWLLGNRKIVSSNPEDETLREYLGFYNVKNLDPELLGKYSDFETYAQFHESYLKKIFLEKGLSYSKRHPRHAKDKAYLNQLIKRIEDKPDHLNSFRNFIDFCIQVRNNLA